MTTHASADPAASPDSAESAPQPGWRDRLLRWVVEGLGASCRLRVVAGEEHLEALIAAPRPVIFSFWHEGALLSTAFLRHRLHGRGIDLTVLASSSKDGELVATLAAQWGIRTVRGSSSRGGREALRGVYRAVVHHNTSPVVIPDGPRGPRRELKDGVIALAQMTKAPIVPLAFAAGRSSTLRSWDRMQVPWPLTKIAVVVGAPHEVPRALSPKAFETERQTLCELLEGLRQQAEEAV